MAAGTGDSELVHSHGRSVGCCLLSFGCLPSHPLHRNLPHGPQIEAGVKPDAMTFSSLIATTRDNSHEGVERAFDVSTSTFDVYFDVFSVLAWLLVNTHSK